MGDGDCVRIQLLTSICHLPSASFRSAGARIVPIRSTCTYPQPLGLFPQPSSSSHPLRLGTSRAPRLQQHRLIPKSFAPCPLPFALCPCPVVPWSRSPVVLLS